MIDSSRIQPLNDAAVRPGGVYVLYWMQQSQRSRFNPALEYAIEQGDALKLPVLVAFGLMDDYPEANLRHYAFMLRGLAEIEPELRRRRMRFVLRRGHPAEVALRLSREAALVVCDRGYLRHQKRWRDEVAGGATCPVVQVEGDVVVPVEVVSDKPEFAARTIRPRIQRHLKRYLVDLPQRNPKRSSLDLHLDLHMAGEIDLSDLDVAVRSLALDRSVPPSARFGGGAGEARRRLERFIQRGLDDYDEARREPAGQGTSLMSPYLHFGQISPVEIALKIRRARAPQSAKLAYLEELIVRRELAINYVNYTTAYDSFDALPGWARRTLEARAGDERPVVYSPQQLERGATHDRYWNACMREMTRTGFMHNSMRMYWGKKILEWSRSPREAFETTLRLNNRYFLDGRDPTSYANVGWIFGLHDRPWGPARPIFGTVRYMNAAGLERKFDMDAYVEFVDSISDNDAHVSQVVPPEGDL